MNILNKTGVPTKYSTDGLSHIEFNAINSTLNSSVDSVNYLLKSVCDLNMETNNLTRTFTLEEAVRLVPVQRRSLGLIIKFLGIDNIYEVYIYSGTNNEDETWKTLENWSLLSTESDIDGGEW